MIYGEELGAGGISTKTLPPQGLNLTLKGGNGKIDCTFTGIASQWLYLGQYYRLIAKPGSAPTSPMDGVQIKDVQVGAIGDAVISASIEGLTNGVQYYVRLYVRGENGWQTSVDAVGTATPVAGIALSTIAASDETTEQIIMLPEQGVPVKFILLKHNYENSGASLVYRKDIYDLRNVGGTYYLNNIIANWLDTTYIGLLAQNIQANIPTVTLPYTASKNSIGQMAARIFLLSRMELGGGSDPYALAEGTAIQYFISKDRRISYFNGVETNYYTRTPHLGRSGNFWCVSKISTTGFSSSSDSEGSRPAFCLPADMLFIPNPDGSYSPLTA